MRRRYKRDNWLDIIFDFAESMSILILLYMVLLFFTDKAQFSHWLTGVIISIISLIGLLLLVKYIKERIKHQKEQEFLKQKFEILKKLKEKGLIQYLNNFIVRFGMETKRGWRYRNYTFDYNRLDDLLDILASKGVQLGRDDLFFVIQHLIDQREHKLTVEAISLKPKVFANLNGTEFEILIYRLFDAMGYKVEHTGKSGDQGGDIIINKGTERTVIQAKRYLKQAVGNNAVQEAVAAKNYYNCNGAMVVTCSSFTPEAISLAKVNNVHLIGKKELQQLLLSYLKESWI